MKRGEQYRLEEEKTRNKESDIATRAKAPQKLLNTPTSDKACEDSNTGGSEKDSSAEGNDAGETGSGRKTPFTAEIILG